LGYSADEMVGKSTPALFHDPGEVAQAAADISKEMNLPVPVGFETFVFKAKLGTFDERQWSYIRKDGQRTQVRLNVTGLYNSNNELYGFMGIAKDLTQEISLQTALSLEKSKALHNAKLASLGEMSAGIAHEINNPLAIIQSNIELLRRFRENKEKFESKTETMFKAIHRIEKIVKGLKKFSRTSESTPHKFESLAHIVNEALVIIETKSKRHTTEVRIDVPSNLHILCDEIEIEQVLVNLVNNGIEAIKNMENRWVHIKAYSELGQVVVQVIDSGQGLPKEIESKLFQPFFTTKSVGEGTGLGLSIVKGILDEHHATISLNRSIPHTCFELRFPGREQKEVLKDQQNNEQDAS
jgi:C4-dicarboxylate-specific signal transduction histidine kinase